MTNYLLRSEEFGYNTFYIRNNMPELEIVKGKEKDIPADAGFVIRWGCTTHVPNGPKIINRIKAMKETCNKGMFRKKAADKGLAPKTWIDIVDWAVTGVFPVIVRPHFHSRSEDLYFCKTMGEVKKALEKVGPNYYISEYIAKDRELRVFIANGRALIVVDKAPKDKKAVTWGCVEEGDFEYIFWDDWPMEAVSTAIKAFNLSKLDFAAVDIIMKDDKAYFLECNTAPEILSYYGKTMAKAFTYMFEGDKGRERIPVKKWENWKDAIHPCMSDKAVVK